MKYSIIHHPSRQINPSIMRELDKMMIYTDFRNEGCTAMHLRALSDAANTREPTVIIEDDAILCHGFADSSQYFYYHLLSDVDETDAVSFYLGQGAPVHMQEDFRRKTEYADKVGIPYVCFENLYHAVCYAVHQPECKELADLDPHAKMIDELLSTKLHKVAYTWPCLADHDDSQPSIVEHEGIRPTVPRVAWRFRG